MCAGGQSHRLQVPIPVVTTVKETLDKKKQKQREQQQSKQESKQQKQKPNQTTTTESNKTKQTKKQQQDVNIHRWIGSFKKLAYSPRYDTSLLFTVKKMKEHENREETTNFLCFFEFFSMN